MPLFEIIKPITATLTVECASKEEAINWANKIVATIEDENGNDVQTEEVVSFEADARVSEIKVESLQGKH